MKNKKFNIIIGFILLSTIARGIGLEPMHNTEGGMLNNICISFQGKAFAAFYNPAVTIQEENTYITAGFYRPYNITGVTYSYLETFIPISSGNSLPLHISHLAAEHYGETNISTSLSKELFEGTAIGMRINTFNVSIENYGNYLSGSLDFAFISRIYDNFHLAAVTGNIFTVKNKDLNYGMDGYMIMEAAYDYNKTATIALQLNHNFNGSFGYGVAMLYNLNSNIALACGIKPEDETWSLGTTMQFSKINLLYALHFHPVLEETHSLGLRFSW